MKPIHKNLLVTSFFLSLATTAFPVFLPVYFKEIGLSNFEIGVSLALLYLTSAILSVFVGYFEEKISKKQIIPQKIINNAFVNFFAFRHC